ncbi:MAG TPA: RagB/SusD family nutrient uptake outer membrane protein [Chitinophagaceae bacterium]|nr:RagB/SusD family nutrient uptake outer membrane protein [Chitinophagaceae bacterium]
MKKIVLILIAGTLLVFASCKKDFLELSPYDQVPQDQAITDEAGMVAAVNGMYAQLRSNNLYGRSLPLYGDLMADNAFISTTNSNRYLIEYNYTFISTNAFSSATWASAYNAILRANNIINASVTSPNANQLKGEALTIRALMYFNLVNWYAKPYTVDPNAEGVPLVLTYDALLKPSRAKVSEVYAQIDKDLADAFASLTSTSKNSSFVTKYVARALQARVALFKGDWAAAKTFAQDVVANGGYTLTNASNLVNYWRNAGPVTTKVETIFEITSDAVNNNGSNSLSYFYDQAGYGDAIGADDLYNKYADTDARIGLFITGTRAGLTVRIVNKYPNTNSAADKDDTKVIRYAEVLLTLAEAAYRTNDEVNARLYLNQLAQKRDPSFTGYISTGAALLDDIILERRKELAFEGMRYLDLQRLGQDVTRVNINNNYVGVTPLLIAASNFRRVFPIPQDELDANPNIGQNNGY